MKSIVLIISGAADEPLDALGGRTPLEAAELPALDRLAADGVLGTVTPVPVDLKPASSVACFPLLGYDPYRYEAGLGLLEAAAAGLAVGPGDWVFRLNLVTIAGDGAMADPSCGHMPTVHGVAFIQALAEELADGAPASAGPGVSGPAWTFHPFKGHKHLLVSRGVDWTGLETHAPYDLVGEWALGKGPAGHPEAGRLALLMDRAQPILAEHPVNRERRDVGLPQATNIWPWGQGPAIQLPSFEELHGVRAALVGGPDYLRGLAKLAGLALPESAEPDDAGHPGAPARPAGRWDALLSGAMDAIEEHDLVYVHVHDADTAAHRGDAAAKVTALEAIDHGLAGPLRGWADAADGAVMVTGDHPSSTRRHAHLTGPVPCAIYGAPSGLLPSGKPFTEAAARERGPLAEPAWDIIHRFLGTFR